MMSFKTLIERGSHIHKPFKSMHNVPVQRISFNASNSVHLNSFSMIQSIRNLSCPAVPRKLNVAMVSRLRKETQCALSKAKDALVAIKAEIHPGTDQQIYDDALAWLHKDMAESGAKKAAKVSNRVTAEGLVGVFCDPRYGRHAAMVEINSETDFVSKSELFSKLVESVGLTVAQSPEIRSTIDESKLHASPIHEIDRSMILQSSMVASDTLSIQTAFADVIGKLGENLQLRRALLALQPFNSTHITSDHQQRVFGVYAHAAEKTKIAGLGKFAAVVSLTSAEPKVDLAESQILRMAIFANKLAQHITGFSPTSIYATPFHTDNNSQETPATSSEDVLMTQQFLFGGGTVLEVLNALSKEIKAKIVVEAFTRYACGEGIEKKPDNFVDEVMKQASQ
ncbi:hypothetical protein BDV3_002656 [Batrachochytrium dendrobatidis]